MSMAPSEEYRRAWSCAASFPPNKEEIYPGHAEAQEFDRHRGKRVLEYGCGGGSDAMSYLRRGCAVDFVDVATANVRAATDRIHAAKLHAKALGRVLQESDRIPVPSALYDVASVHGVLHHILDPRPVLLELRRVLKPRGLLYAMLYTETLYARAIPSFRPGASVFAEFCRYTDSHPAYARWYTEDEGVALLENAAFHDVQVTGVYNNGDFRTFRAVAP